MSITSASAKALAEIGCNVHVTAEAGYTTESVKAIIEAAMKAGGHVTVEGSRYTTESLKAFARIGKERITIIL